MDYAACDLKGAVRWAVIKETFLGEFMARFTVKFETYTSTGGTSDASAALTILQQGEIKLDAARHTAFCGDKPLDLFATEFSLLKHFLSNPEIVFSRNQITAAIRGPDYPVSDRSVDVQILGLRKKLGKAGDMIETIRGVGYRLRVQE